MSHQIQVTRSSMPGLDEYIDEIKDMWETHWLTNMGPKHKEMQAQLLDYMGVENMVCRKLNRLKRVLQPASRQNLLSVFVYEKTYLFLA